MKIAYLIFTEEPLSELDKMLLCEQLPAHVMTYEYVCKSCGHQWEAQQSIKDEPLTECPQCNEAQAKRQISRGGSFILKGGGWYADLYSSQKPAGGSSEKSNKKPTGGSSNKSSKSES